MEIKVMTFNIRHGKGMDKKVDLFRIADVIQKSGADLIGLNEVDKRFSNRSGYVDQISWLSEQLKMDYAYSPSVSKNSKKSTEEQQYGNALLSRYPIIKKKQHSFNILKLLEGRSVLEAEIQEDRQIFHVNVTHLSLHPLLHRLQTSFILSQLDNNSRPLIVMGDWNMKPRSKGWKKMITNFQDAWDIGGRGTGNTYPSIRPRIRLDYIFVSKNIQIVDAKVETITPKASDHLPLTARLRF